MQKRIVVTVEIERMYADLGTKRRIEGRGCLTSCAIHIDFRKTVPGENVCTHALT